MLISVSYYLAGVKEGKSYPQEVLRGFLLMIMNYGKYCIKNLIEFIEDL